ncbi:MAG: hypothetical protein JNL47_09285 [Bacteroidia bacterium]|nr:hypothetical protein [Bacteroidia bacterium]
MSTFSSLTLSRQTIRVESFSAFTPPPGRAMMEEKMTSSGKNSFTFSIASLNIRHLFAGDRDSWSKKRGRFVKGN